MTSGVAPLALGIGWQRHGGNTVEYWLTLDGVRVGGQVFRQVEGAAFADAPKVLARLIRIAEHTS